jgi:hypothetical protein
MASVTETTFDTITDLLGDDAESLLEHRCETIGA